MSKSTDGWTTVRRGGGDSTWGSGRAAASGGGGGGSGYRRWGDSSATNAAEPAREMPSAFGGGNRERQVARREEDARRAWEERREATEKERAAKAEEVRQAKLRDFTDTEQYPSLGGGAGRPAAAAPKALNFRDMARETAARSALEEAEAAAAAKRRELEASRRAYGGAGSGAAGPRLYRHGSYDDGPVDHDYPDEEGYYPPDGEDEYDAAPPGHVYPEVDEAGVDAEAEVEFNSHLAVTRRRGDKSDW